MFELGYFALFIFSFLAATVVPFSSEGVLVAMVYGGFNPWYIVVLASVGNTLGGISSYYLGYVGNWTILEKWFRTKADRLDKYLKIIKRWGSIIAFFTWLPFVGDVLAVALGFAKTSWLKSFLLMALGKTLRYLVVVWTILYWF
ncbi:MAG: DedA family protein [Bacteroidales bacterium]|nr:DedA family protein [Bacteroidales bacterium]